MDYKSPESMPEIEHKATVNALYDALAKGETEKVSRLIDNELEWWYHGPQNCHHMMRVLTGESSSNEFVFEPRSMTVIDDHVIVEGWEGAKVYWVHVWTVKNGLVLQFREYFNTWLTVTRLKPMKPMGRHQRSTLWQSQPRDLFKRSLPGLMLAM